MKGNGQWKYFRFQTHHLAENVTAEVFHFESNTSTSDVVSLAVYLNQDTSPTEIVNRDGAPIFPPFTQEQVELQEDTRVICGSRTVYVGVTQFPWNSHGGEVVTFDVRLLRSVPSSAGTLCKAERWRSWILVYMIQPTLVVGMALCSAFFAIRGLWECYQLKLRSRELLDDPY